MIGQTGKILRWTVVMGAMIIASCGGGESAVTVEQSDSPPTTTSAPTPTAEQSEAAQDTPESVGQCEAPATEIAIESSFASEILGQDQPPPERKYFCIVIHAGVTSITFELTQTTSDLNLYVGYPDLETLQQGGIWFWSANDRGAEDKVIVVEPVLTDYVNSGAYYIEVSPQDFRASSPFTLRVHIP